MLLATRWFYARSRRLGLLSLVCGCMSIAPLLVRAQSGGGMDTIGTNGRHIIRGRIYFPSGRSADSRPRVRLENLNSGDLSVLADMKGEFTFGGLAPGNYTVVVEGGNEFETVRESVFIDAEARSPRTTSMPTVSRIYTVTIHLIPKVEFRGTVHKTGVVDASMAAVPAEAKALYEKALEAASRGDGQRAIDLLNSALSQYPKFPQALNELGVQYLKLGRADRAAEALRSAVNLAPNSFTPQLNYGIALLNQKAFQQAATQLRAALRIKESAPTAHMYLAIALINLHSYDDAEKELLRGIEVGGQDLGPVHYYLGGIYWRKHDYKRAADELEKYLQIEPNAPDAARVLGTIKELRSKARSLN